MVFSIFNNIRDIFRQRRADSNEDTSAPAAVQNFTCVLNPVEQLELLESIRYHRLFFHIIAGVFTLGFFPVIYFTYRWFYPKKRPSFNTAALYGGIGYGTASESTTLIKSVVATPQVQAYASSQLEAPTTEMDTVDTVPQTQHFQVPSAGSSMYPSITSLADSSAISSSPYDQHNNRAVVPVVAVAVQKPEPKVVTVPILLLRNFCSRKSSFDVGVLTAAIETTLRVPENYRIEFRVCYEGYSIENELAEMRSAGRKGRPLVLIPLTFSSSRLQEFDYKDSILEIQRLGAATMLILLRPEAENSVERASFGADAALSSSDNTRLGQRDIIRHCELFISEDLGTGVMAIKDAKASQKNAKELPLLGNYIIQHYVY